MVRFAIGVFPARADVPAGMSRIGEVDITMQKGASPKDSEQHFLLTAKVDLPSLPENDDAGRVVIPAPAREECELAIEALCNVVATFQGCSRSILSPSPAVALECADKSEREYLEASRGIHAVQRGDSGARNAIPLSEQSLAGISDRLVGVALLAEAYTEGELGRFREFLRFFEVAFRTPVTELSKKLHRFLAPGFGYTRAEINNWIQLRDPLSHADLKKSKVIATTSDVRRFVLRAEQAALDVLFNKATWGDNSIARRNLWTPDAFTTSEGGKIVVKQGSKLSVLFRQYDAFDVYPRNLTASVTTIEDSWYVKLNEDGFAKLPMARAEVTASEPAQG